MTRLRDWFWKHFGVSFVFGFNHIFDLQIIKKGVDFETVFDVLKNVRYDL